MCDKAASVQEVVLITALVGISFAFMLAWIYDLQDRFHCAVKSLKEERNYYKINKNSNFYKNKKIGFFIKIFND